ncbi:hypothetical protein SLEP1_g23550 [Rubroshorea leprosula]|uniref:Uncharacterized protein n=1 Tax=Rubroshorea leprosula TaxID=152421 RepID=A0AAV5JLJ2_9ROSI|nr:hypothetical protein SLEP1_g23550 [Rubroshorea leprosula]
MFSRRCRLPCFIYVKVPISNWLALKSADLAIAFPMGSALLSWCSNRQPLFPFIH